MSCPIDVVQLTVRPSVVYNADTSGSRTDPGWSRVYPDKQRTLPIEHGESEYTEAFM